MKFPLLRGRFYRAASLALALCLVVSLTSFAWADAPIPAGGAATGDAVVVVPPAPPEPPTPPEPSQPAPPQPAPPSGDVSPVGDVTTSDAAVTTGPAANLLLNGENHADLMENNTVLQITWNDDKAHWTNNMEAVLNSVSNLPGWNTLKRVELVGSADRITEWNWRTLLNRYSVRADSPPVLDLSRSGLKIISGSYSDTSSYLKQVIFPAGLTQIGSQAFSNCSSLTSVDLPAGLTTIEGGAFSGSALQSIDLSDCKSLTSLYRAFQGCASLTSVTLPTELTSLGEYAFSDCIKLASIDLPAGLTSLGVSTFSGCIKLASIALPSGLTHLGSSAFSGCTSLTSIVLPAGLTSLWNSTFSGCSALTSVALPAGLTTIGIRAFSDCIKLTSIALPAGLTTIGSEAFSGSALQSIDLSDCKSLTSLGDRAFSGCASLTSVTLPTGLESIGGYAFAGCSSLTGIDFPAGLTHIGGGAFSGSALETIDLSEHTSLTSTSISSIFLGCENLTEINLTGCTGLTSIGNQAFNNFKKLKEINLTNCTGLESIGDYAFFRCKELNTLTLNGCSKLTSFGKDALQDCTALATVDFTNCAGLKSIENEFADRAPLTTVNLTGCTGLTSLGNTFNGRTALQSIDLSKCTHLTSIEPYAFAGCANLTSIHIPDTVTAIGKNAFLGCAKLADVSLGSVTTIGENAFWGCAALESLDLSGCKNLDFLGECAFINCKKLASLDLSGCQKLTAIGDSTFAGCETLSEIHIPDTVTAIGEKAFLRCAKLASLDLSGCQKLTAIGDATFAGCEMLSEIRIPDTVTTIGEKAFLRCAKLADVDLRSVTTIGANAFQWCAALPDITFSPGLTFIGSNAFTGCPSLHDVYFQRKQPPVLERPATPQMPATQVPANQVFDVDNTAVGADVTLLYFPKDGTGYQAPDWQGTTPDERMIAYDLPNTVAGTNRVEWSKPGENGAPPAYEVWDTLGFQAAADNSADDPAIRPQRGDYKLSTPTGWQLLPPRSGSPVAMLAAAMAAGANGVPLPAPLAPGLRGAFAGGSFPLGGPYTGQLFPSRDRPYGMCTLQINSHLLIYVGDDYTAPAAHGYREFPIFNGNSNTTVELLPPPTPAEASWLLSVQNGTGGGYFEAEHSAPIVARLHATPPAPGAKFLRWELVSGTGSFADANAPETRFTMAVGNSTVRAVFATAGATAKPVPTPKPTPNPATNDRGGAGLLAAGLLLAAGAAVTARRKRKRGLGK